jgi:hypothetical protein
LIRRSGFVIRPSYPWLVLALTVALYVLCEVRSFTPAYLECDPDGYLWVAKGMADGRPLAVAQTDPFLYPTHVWVENKRGEVSAKFAPGYPALLAFAYRWFGDEGMFYVSPFMGALALVGAFLLFRLWLSPFASTLAVVTLAANKSYLFYTGYLLTHATDLCFVTWGMYFLWKWRRRPDPAWGAAAGLCLGYAAAVRHTSALLALVGVVAVVACVVRDRKEGRSHARAIAALVLAGMFFPLLLCAYNDMVYGGPFTSGYALSDEQYAFSFRYFLHNCPYLIQGLNNDVVPLLFPLGLLGMMLVGPWPDRLMRLLWLVPAFVVYAAYYWFSPNMAYYRFLIVAMPVLVGGGYLLIESLNVRRAARVVAMGVLCAAGVAAALPGIGSALDGDLYGNNNRQVAAGARVIASNLSDDAVLFTDWPFVDYVGTRKHWTLYNQSAFSKGYGRQFRSHGREEHRGVERSPRQQRSRIERFRRFYDLMTDDDLRQMKRVIAFSALKQGRQVAFLVRKGQEGGAAGELGDDVEPKVLTELKVSWDWWGNRDEQSWVLCEVKLRAPQPAPPAPQP